MNEYYRNFYFIYYIYYYYLFLECTRLYSHENAKENK